MNQLATSVRTRFALWDAFAHPRAPVSPWPLAHLMASVQGASIFLSQLTHIWRRRSPSAWGGRWTPSRRPASPLPAQSCSIAPSTCPNSTPLRRRRRRRRRQAGTPCCRRCLASSSSSSARTASSSQRPPLVRGFTACRTTLPPGGDTENSSRLPSKN